MIIKRDTGCDNRKACIREYTFFAEIYWNFENYKTCGQSAGLINTLITKILGCLMQGTKGHGEKLSTFNAKILNEKVGLVIHCCKDHRKLFK